MDDLNNNLVRFELESYEIFGASKIDANKYIETICSLEIESSGVINPNKLFIGFLISSSLMNSIFFIENLKLWIGFDCLYPIQIFYKHIFNRLFKLNVSIPQPK